MSALLEEPLDLGPVDAAGAGQAVGPLGEEGLRLAPEDAERGADGAQVAREAGE